MTEISEPAVVVDVVAKASTEKQDVNTAISTYIRDFHAEITKIISQASAMPHIASVAFENALGALERAAGAIEKHGVTVIGAIERKL